MVRNTVTPCTSRSSRMCSHRFARDCGSSPVGRLVHEQERRLVDQAERDVEAAALAARQRAAGRSHVPSRSSWREQLSAALRGLFRGEAVQAAVVDELLADERLRRRAAPLRDVADAPPDGDRLAAQVVAGDRRLAGGRRASSVVSIRRVVVLPAPLGPRKPTISPVPTVDVDPSDGFDRRRRGSGSAWPGRIRLNHIVKFDHRRIVKHE